MSITHEQAHRLIQSNMEQMLDSQESARLSAHLRECRECDTYAREIKEVTNLLPTMMKKQWSASPVPLSREHNNIKFPTRTEERSRSTTTTQEKASE